MPLPDDLNIARIHSDIEYLSGTLGARPHGSQNARLASLYIRDELEAAGWEPQFIQIQENIISCRGEGKALFLAHSDSVPNSPGTIDNAVGVGILLELARSSEATDLCLGFPAAEELGLVGSQFLSRLIEQWHPNSDELDLVVSLDLTGYGVLSVVGLNAKWDTTALTWLNTHTDIVSPFAYQLVSRSFPHLERSDHASFTPHDVLTMQLLGRGKSGVFPAYHQPEDMAYSDEAILDTIEALNTMAVNIDEVPSPSNGLDPAVVIGDSIVAGWIVWVIILLGTFMGLSQFRQFKALGPLVLWGTIAALIASLPIFILCQFGLYAPTPAELTAANVMGVAPTGWWAGATWVSIAGAGLWFVFRQYKKITAPASLLCALFAIGGLIIDPIVAFPFALSGFIARYWTPAALLPAAYWLQPTLLRELSFHGLMEPWFWGVFWLLAIPAFAISSKVDANV